MQPSRQEQSGPRSIKESPYRRTHNRNRNRPRPTPPQRETGRMLQSHERNAHGTVQPASYAEPDIYYTENGDGTFTANRLTVKPTNRAADVTPPYLNECTATSVQVCWKTKADGSSSIVRFGTSADNLTETRTGVSRKLADTYYWNTVKLDNLSPDAVYYYQVESNGVTSNVCRFRTMPTADSTDKLRILFIGDHQRNEHSDYEWLLRMAKRTLDKKYGKAQVPVEGGLYVMTHSSTHDKKKQLDKISRELDLGLKVEEI